MIFIDEFDIRIYDFRYKKTKEDYMIDILDRETMTALDEIQMTLTVDSVEYKVSTMPSACMTCTDTCFGFCEGNCDSRCYGGCEGDCAGTCKGQGE